MHHNVRGGSISNFPSIPSISQKYFLKKIKKYFCRVEGNYMILPKSYSHSKTLDKVVIF